MSALTSSTCLKLAGFGFRQRVIGLLGGSFNPAHAGHVHVSVTALRQLGLDEVWWLVSPQNPLKPVAGMAPLGERLAQARVMVRHPRIRVTAVERCLGTRYTVDTLHILTRRFPRVRFVWLMGADNLMQISRWARWRKIFQEVAVAVFSRAPYSLKALGGIAAQNFGRSRLGTGQARCIGSCRPPVWTFLAIRLHPASSTAIRARAGK